MTIRRATSEDAEIIATLVNELAAFEDRAYQANPDIRKLRRHLSRSERPYCEALLAEDEDETVVGFALFYPTYSTFRTCWGIHLEDLYVREGYRRSGVGQALMEALAREAEENDYVWIEWYVLDWNQKAQEFYRKLGAREVDDWLMMVVSGSSLKTLARNAK